MSDQVAARPRAAAFSWQRVLWLSIASLLLLAGLWNSRGALSSSRPATGIPAVPLTPAPVALSVPGVAVAHLGAVVRLDNRLVTVNLDSLHGTVSLHWSGNATGTATDLPGGVAAILLRGNVGSGPAGALLSSDYARHRVETLPFKDRLGSGLQVTLIHQDARYPLLQQQIRIYRGLSELVLTAQVGASNGTPLDVTRLDPFRLRSTAPLAVPGAANPLVLAINGLTADHMPRQFVPLSAMPAQGPVPYLTALMGTAGSGALVAGALQAKNWFPTVELEHDAAGLTGLTLTDTGPVNGRLIASEPFLLGRFTSGTAALHAYAAAASYTSAMPRWTGGVQLGWSSWGAFELAVNQARVQRNVNFMAAHLRTLGYTTIHIDDGWQRAYGDWQAGSAFPDGMNAIVQYIHSRGLKASLWLAPFLIAPNAWPAQQHPDWLLRHSDGSAVTITVSSPVDILDVSNPQALAYVRSVCAQVRDWGFDAVKLDFLYVGSLEGQRYRFDLNGMQAYSAAMRVVYDTLEADPQHPMYLTGVQQGLLPSGYFHAWRAGRDIESKINADNIPTWDLVRREALAVSTFSFANGALYATDPDDLLVRHVTGARNLSADELQSYASMVALGGTVWLSGDDLPSLARQGRLSYLTNPEVLAVVRAGRAGAPAALADQATGPAPVWMAPQVDGSLVLGIFDWGDTRTHISLRLADLGLSTGRTYQVRDLWARASLPASRDILTLTLRPHQSYLLRLSAPAR